MPNSHRATNAPTARKLIADALAELDRDDALATLAGLSASVRTAAALASCPVETHTRTLTGRPALQAC